MPAVFHAGRTRYCFVLLLAIVLSVGTWPALAVSDVEHAIDDSVVTITFNGVPPFLINIRGDDNIGADGGFVFAKTNNVVFRYELSQLHNPAGRFYYSVKDGADNAVWSETKTFDVSSRNICDVLVAGMSEITDVTGDSTPSTDIVNASLRQIGNTISFEMTLADTPNPLSGCYKFLIDEDGLFSTGDPRGTMGVDYFITYCGGNVDIYDADGSTRGLVRGDEYLLAHSIDGDSLRVTIDGSFLENSAQLRWSAECFSDNGSDTIDQPMRFPLAKDNLEVTFRTVPSSNTFDRRLAYLPLGESLDVAIDAKVNNIPVVIGRGVLSSASDIVVLNGMSVTATDNVGDIRTPVTDIVFSSDNCGVILHDPQFKLYLGDRFQGQLHSYVLPGGMIPSEFSELEAYPYPYTLQEVMDRYEVNKGTDLYFEREQSITGVDPIAITGYDLLVNFKSGTCGEAPPGYFFSLGQSCIEAESSGEFKWDVLAHEMGHYFTLNSKSFRHITEGVVSEDGTPFYLEASASLVACWALEEMQDDLDSYGLSYDAKNAIINQAYSYSYFPGRRVRTLDDLHSYEQNPDFSRMNVGTFFDIFVSVSNEYGSETTRNFFRIFSTANENNPIFSTADTVAKKHTFIAAAMSAAAGADLRAQFKGWEFPIDDAYFITVYPQLQELAHES